MTKKKTAASKSETKAKTTAEVSPTVKTTTEQEAIKNKELVMEAGIDIKSFDPNEAAENAPLNEPKKEDTKCAPAPAEKKIENHISSYTVVINTSQNPILLSGDSKEESIFIAPKEIKQVKSDLLRKLLQNKIVRYWFDKGILTSNTDANETTANEAVAPAHLSQPVERHNGANVSASVTKLEKEGSVTINL